MRFFIFALVLISEIARTAFNISLAVAAAVAAAWLTISAYRELRDGWIRVAEDGEPEPTVRIVH